MTKHRLCEEEQGKYNNEEYRVERRQALVDFTIIVLPVIVISHYNKFDL